MALARTAAPSFRNSGLALRDVELESSMCVAGWDSVLCSGTLQQRGQRDGQETGERERGMTCNKGRTGDRLAVRRAL